MTLLSLTVIRDVEQLWDNSSIVSLFEFLFLLLPVSQGIFARSFLVINVTIYCRCLMNSSFFITVAVNGRQ